MPDPIEILTAMAAAGGTTALIVLLFGWPWRAPCARRSALGWALGIGVGFWVGAWLFGVRPKWPPIVDQDRLLWVIVPAATLLEMVIALFNIGTWAWLGRVVMAGAVAPIVLRGSTYLDEWSLAMALAILGGLGVALTGAWWSLTRGQDRWAPMSLAVACLGGGVTIMLSGYETGGKLTLVVGATLVAVVLASFLLSGPIRSNGGVGVAVVLFAALLIAGRFFGSLTTLNAVILFAAPLLSGPVGLLPFRPWVRGTLRVLIVTVPLAFVCWQAVQAFKINSRTPSNPYSDYGM